MKKTAPLTQFCGFSRSRVKIHWPGGLLLQAGREDAGDEKRRRWGAGLNNVQKLKKHRGYSELLNFRNTLASANLWRKWGHFYPTSDIETLSICLSLQNSWPYAWTQVSKMQKNIQCFAFMFPPPLREGRNASKRSPKNGFREGVKSKATEGGGKRKGQNIFSARWGYTENLIFCSLVTLLQKKCQGLFALERGKESKIFFEGGQFLVLR